MSPEKSWLEDDPFLLKRPLLGLRWHVSFLGCNEAFIVIHLHSASFSPFHMVFLRFTAAVRASEKNSRRFLDMEKTDSKDEDEGNCMFWGKCHPDYEGDLSEKTRNGGTELDVFRWFSQTEFHPLASQVCSTSNQRSWLGRLELLTYVEPEKIRSSYFSDMFHKKHPHPESFFIHYLRVEDSNQTKSSDRWVLFIKTLIPKQPEKIKEHQMSWAPRHKTTYDLHTGCVPCCSFLMRLGLQGSCRKGGRKNVTISWKGTPSCGWSKKSCTREIYTTL